MSRAALIALILAAVTDAARPAVIEVSPTGFATSSELTVKAAPEQVFHALLHDIGKWWNPEHTYSGKSANLSIEARPGGCFCERLAHGGGVEHARVINLMPPSMLRLSGAFGPLQSAGLAGTMSWGLTPTAEGTRVELSYFVGGYMHGGFAPIAPAVDGVLNNQLERLKSFAETGTVP